MGSTSDASRRSLAVTEPARQLTFDQQAGADRVLGVYARLAKGTKPIAPHRHEFWEVAFALNASTRLLRRVVGSG